MAEDKKDKSIEALDLAEDAGTKTIKATFRRKVKALQSGQAGPVSKKTFQELNEAYQFLMQDRAKQSTLQKKKVTILSSDVAGYSKMMAEHEAETLEFFALCKEVFEEKVDAAQGRVFNTAGDAILAEFEYPYNAVHCAMEIQKELRALNAGQPDHLKIQFRMGVNQGEVFVQEEGDLLGDAVNLAARIQTVAKPGGVCVSGDLYELIRNRVTYNFTSLGPQSFKNIPQPVVTWAVTENEKVKAPPPDPTIAAFAAPKLTTRKVEKKSAVQAKSLFQLGGAAAAIAAAAIWWSSRPATAPSVPASPASSAAPAKPAATIGQLWVSTTPDTKITLVRDGLTEFTGTTPVQADLKPGKYKLRMENADYLILEEKELDVVLGPNRFETVFNKKKVGAPLAPPSSSTYTPDEEQLKRSADEGDVEALYRLGKKRLEKESFEDALLYLKMAAAKGHGMAQLELGRLFYSGKLESGRSSEAALYWALRAGLEGAPGATDFLVANKFPPEYALVIQNQRRIASNDPKGARLRDMQLAFLDDLRETLREKNLPY